MLCFHYNKSKVLPYLAGLGKYSALYINFYPSNPETAVTEIEEYEQLKKEIKRKLFEVTDNNGEKIITDVWFKEELYIGKYLPEIYDIIIKTQLLSGLIIILL